VTWVKSYNPDGTCTYFRSIEECCKVFGIKYHQTLVRLIDNAQLADDGKTFFDYPTKQEVEMLERLFKDGEGSIQSMTEDRIQVTNRRNDNGDMRKLR